MSVIHGIFMKKYIYSVLGLLALQTAIAQTVTLNPREVTKGAPNAIDPNGNYNIEFQSRITNNSTDAADSIFTWKVIALEQPSAWQLDFCDPIYCRTDAALNDQYDFKMRKDQSGFMKADFYFNATSGNGLVKVLIFAKNNPANNDTLTINTVSWVTAVNEVTKTKSVSFYPNPVREQLTVKFPAKTDIKVDIYNVLGVKVKSFNHNDLSTTVNVSDLQNGIYFIRFEENGKLYTKQFTKAE